MKNNHRILIVAVCGLLLSVSSLFAQDVKALRKPYRNEVLLVFKLGMTPEVDHRFFTEYYNKINNGLFDQRTKEKVLPPSVTLLTGRDKPSLATLFSSTWQDMVSKDGYLVVYVKPDKSRILKMQGFYYFLAQLYDFCLYLPLDAEVRVPDDVSFLYLGTLVYQWEGHQFTIKGMRVVDEYEDALDFLRGEFGPSVELSRAPLQTND